MCWLLTRKLPVNSCELIGGVGQDQHMSMRFHECHAKEEYFYPSYALLGCRRSPVLKMPDGLSRKSWSV